MFNKALLLIMFAAMPFVFASTAKCQSPELVPIEVLSPNEMPVPPEVPHRPASGQLHGQGAGLPFVSGHSQVPASTRTRFESVGNCNQCGCNQPCNCNKTRWERYKARKQCECWGYPEYFCERPHGSYLRLHLDAQIANGIAGQMVIYQYDFFDADQPQADGLKPAGLQTLSRIADLSMVSPTPIMVESTGDPGRDAFRRGVVLEALAQMSIPMSEDQVITIDKDPFGISGDEAVFIHGNMIQQAQSASQSGDSFGRARSSGLSIPVFPLITGGGGR